MFGTLATWRFLDRWERRTCVSALAVLLFLTVVVLAGFIGKAIPPRAGGEPYVKER